MKKTLLALATLATTLACSTALAQGYVGIAGGTTQQSVNCSGWSSCDKGDTGFKLYGGYRFSKLAAIELGYTDFGSASLSAGSVASGSYSATALGIGGALFLPIAPKFTGIARLGLASVDADYSTTGPFGLFGASSSESSIEPYIGFALAYALTPQLSLTGSFDYTRADYPRGSGNARMLGLGLSLSF